MPKQDEPDDRDERSEVHALQRDVVELRSMIDRVAQASSIEHVISNGFADLSAKLQPLRDLTARREPLPDDAVERLRTLRRALKRPRWRGSNFDAVEDDADEPDYPDRAGSMSS